MALLLAGERGTAVGVSTVGRGLCPQEVEGGRASRQETNRQDIMVGWPAPMHSLLRSLIHSLLQLGMDVGMY